MRLKDYLSVKYGVHTPTTILYAEARVFGIKFPLEKGWLNKYGDIEITPDVEKRMKSYLQREVDKQHSRSDSAARGIKILNDAYIHLKTIPEACSPDFLKSKSWLRLRIKAFEKYGQYCCCCGATPKDGIRLNVDHVKPRKLYPELALDINNLQILCNECNSGKGNWNLNNFND